MPTDDIFIVIWYAYRHGKLKAIGNCIVFTVEEVWRMIQDREATGYKTKVIHAIVDDRKERGKQCAE